MDTQGAQRAPRCNYLPMETPSSVQRSARQRRSHPRTPSTSVRVASGMPARAFVWLNRTRGRAMRPMPLR